MNLKRVCAGVLAGVVAASAVVLPVEPVKVHADAGEIAGLADFLDAAYDISSGGVPAGWSVNGYAAYVAALWAINEALDHPLSTGETVNVSSWSGVSGWFVYDGSRYPVSLCLTSDCLGVDEGGISICKSPLFDIRISFYKLNQTTFPFYIYQTLYNNTLTYRFQRYPEGGSSSSVNTRFDINSNSSIFAVPSYSYSLEYGRINALFNMKISNGSIVEIPANAQLTDYLSFQSSSNKFIGGQGISFNFPSQPGDLDVDYIVNQFNPYYVSLYPDIEPYIFAPYIPEYEPTDDLVPGLPRDWTIKNPQLPSIPDLDFQIPTADFDSLDVSPIRQNLSGVGFWWDLLETVLDTTAFKGLFLAFAIIGLAIFVLWKLGA